MSENKSTYYKELIPNLIEKYKIAVEQCLEIISEQPGSDISDDKMHNVLKAKRMAGEDAKYYAKEIDDLQNEINGIKVEEEETGSSKHPTKRYANK